MQKVGIGEFVRRQTPQSGYSHFEGTWNELALRTAEYIENGHFDPGPREGIRLVHFPAHRFFSGIVEVEDSTELVATFEARREHESKHIVVRARGGEKLPAKHVRIVVYHRDVLLEDREVVGDHEWEIVSINARPTREPEPMNPLAMARNMLGMVGGTRADYTAHEFAQAIIFWSQHAMCGEIPAEELKRDRGRQAALDLAIELLGWDIKMTDEQKENELVTLQEMRDELRKRLNPQDTRFRDHDGAMQTSDDQNLVEPPAEN